MRHLEFPVYYDKEYGRIKDDNDVIVVDYNVYGEDDEIDQFANHLTAIINQGLLYYATKADLATAEATISALEGKLAAAMDVLKHYANPNHWSCSNCADDTSDYLCKPKDHDQLFYTADEGAELAISALEAFEALQKENTDES